MCAKNSIRNSLIINTEWGKKSAKKARIRKKFAIVNGKSKYREKREKSQLYDCTRIQAYEQDVFC